LLLPGATSQRTPRLPNVPWVVRPRRRLGPALLLLWEAELLLAAEELAEEAVAVLGAGWLAAVAAM
jgi:hypothetical protein